MMLNPQVFRKTRASVDIVTARATDQVLRFMLWPIKAKTRTETSIFGES